MVSQVLTAAQMQAIEKAAMDSGVVTGLELMERAGRGAVDTLFSTWPELAQAPRRALVLCGPGNNGGDGFVVARLLKEWGWEVRVLLYGDPDKLPPDARTNHDRWRELGAVGDLPGALDPDRPWQDTQLVVDALFGTGLTRPLTDLAQVLGALREAASTPPGADAPHVLAIDLPSGLDADSGRPLIPAHGGPGSGAAHLTAAFHAFKLGHVLGQGAALCGESAVVDIGLEAPVGSPQEIARLVDAPPAARLAKRAGDHKYAHGHALILSGPAGTGGAARLAARGALRIGAGLVSVVCDDTALPEHAAQLTAIMIRRAEDGDGLAQLLRDERLNALCLGPGLGLDRARDMVRAATAAGRGTVLDADALTAFEDDPEALFSMLHDRCILTPHAGEFARLFPDLAARLDAAASSGPAFSRLDAVREAARRAGCTVLLKGPDTVIAAPSGRASIHAAHQGRAAPWLATAGAGDVLAGFITGLMARGLDPVQAAEAAAWIHVEAARAYGPGLIAEDLPEQVPRVLRALT